MLCTPAFAALALALFLATSSCRMDVLAPSRNLASVAQRGPGTSVATGNPDHAQVAIESMVPAIIHLKAEARRDSLFIRGQLQFRDHLYTPFYDPSHVGGWALQVFIDNDLTNAGYWRGYDFVVRGVEWSPSANTFVTRQITLDPNTPGGWGPDVGSATFTQKPRGFEVAIPLAAIGGFEKSVNYCVETYATIACPDCGEGFTQEWSDDYFETLGDQRSHSVAGLSPFGDGSLAARSTPLRGHGADADPRLAHGWVASGTLER